MPPTLTASYIQAGFRKTAIYPYNRHLFTELDLAPAFVKYRPDPKNITEAEVVSVPDTSPPEDETPPLSHYSLINEPLLDRVVLQQATNSCRTQQKRSTEGKNGLNTPPRRHSSISIQQPSTSAQPTPFSDVIVFTPKAIRTLPNSPPKKSNRWRKTRKSTIYTERKKS